MILSRLYKRKGSVFRSFVRSSGWYSQLTCIHMDASKHKKVLISGASIAGLSTAYFLNKLGYQVTIVETAAALRTGGTAVDVKGATVDIAKRMGIFDTIKAYRLTLETIEFKLADDSTAGAIGLNGQVPDDEIEIEREQFIRILFEAVKNDVTLLFGNAIAALHETGNAINATFKDGAQQAFDLVIGCDGSHSGVRKIWFGPESAYTHFLEQYFSITIVNKLLIRPNTMQFYNVPGKCIMLNAYNHKTDIIFCFVSEQEIPYDYRNEAQQRQFVEEQFANEGWRTAELLNEVRTADTFYFDKLCQIKMPSWSKGRVVLVGDAAYCASPAAGMGASLAMEGAAALADALQVHTDDAAAAFQAYEKKLRPFIEDVQAEAVRNGLEALVPRTEEAIQRRNAQTDLF